MECGEVAGKYGTYGAKSKGIGAKSKSAGKIKKYRAKSKSTKAKSNCIKDSVYIDAAKLGTGLDNMQVVQMYELIYYLYKTNRYDKIALRILYKYQYYLTSGDKKSNPEWGNFIERMDLLYNEMF